MTDVEAVYKIRSLHNPLLEILAESCVFVRKLFIVYVILQLQGVVLDT